MTTRDRNGQAGHESARPPRAAYEPQSAVAELAISDGDTGPSMRLLAYSHDTVGLGHLRRTLGICDDLVRTVPGFSALVVTGSPIAGGFKLPPRVDYLKLPSVRKLGNAAYASRSLDLKLDRLLQLRTCLIRDATHAFEPDLLLVDKTPAGVNGELLGALATVPSRTRVVLGLRDILDEPEALRREWSRAGLWAVIETYFDAVWIYGDPGIYDTVREYGFPASIADKCVYLGYLPKRSGLLPREAIERELELDGRRLILVTAGGGEDGFPIFDHYLRGLESNRGPRNALHCLVTGPGMPEQQRESLRSRARRVDAAFMVFSGHMTSLIAAADLVVTMGGYNTLTEILSLGGRAVVVPRVTPRAEQLIRAQCLERRGLVHLFHPDRLADGDLMAAVETELSRPHKPLPSAIRFNGPEGIRQEIGHLFARNRHGSMRRRKALA